MLSSFRAIRSGVVLFIRQLHDKKLMSTMPFPSIINLTVLSNGFDGTCKSILIEASSTRYLLNCGEGTQRVLSEHKSKSARIHHALFSQMSWDHVSGLLGVALTARTAGVKTLTVHGPPDVENLMKLTKHFADSETTDIVSSSILTRPFVDDAFKIHAFPISLSRAAVVNSSAEPDPKQRKLEDNNLTTYMYYFQTFQQRRKLNVNMCRMLGIPDPVLLSSAIRDVIEGDGIQLSNGKFISSASVTTPSFRCPNFLILECPTLDLIPEIEANRTFWDALITPPSEPKLKPGLSLIVHLLPPGMFSTPEYQNFIERISDFLEQHKSVTAIDQTEVENPQMLEESLRHLVLDGTGCLPPIKGIYAQSTILNHFFDSNVYPKLYNMECKERIHSIKEAASLKLDSFSKVVYAQPEMVYAIRPWLGLKQPEPDLLEEADLVNSAFDPYYVTREEAESKFATMQLEVKKYEASLVETKEDSLVTGLLVNKSMEYPVITFLGTGSSCPSKYRNCSCILVQLNSNDYIMLDCGEGSLNQLQVLCGPDKTRDILRGLRLVLISHMHADHHGGLLTIALARSRLLAAEPDAPLLAVLTPPGFIRWFQSFQELFSHEPTMSLFVVPEVYVSPCPVDTRPPLCPLKSESPYNQAWTSLLKDLCLEVHPIKVPHTRTSWAYLLRGSYTCELPTEKQWSLVFSGDTPECEDLVEAGKNCDLLIHEATMIDEHEELAIKAKHSTVGSALRVGESMNASFIVLTHFSQRYGRVPHTDIFRPNVITAFDFMQVRLSDLSRLAHYMPYYKFAFAKHWERHRTAAECYRWRKFRESGEEIPISVAENNEQLRSG